ncbi:hypothetical protein JOC36_001526 [Weissella uvarum]|uniref:hypothetical protein n=1 Tax=Weissella uvarum TaxID=1479233 RepID=UPI00195F277A|nr:hypothetical protein [Weissella uvarum]MBM7617933.1 hypothetical protein [Weissella uvarum]MCM0596071.1 hypothetical protein [Weissella uvarum]
MKLQIPTVTPTELANEIDSIWKNINNPQSPEFHKFRLYLQTARITLIDHLVESNSNDDDLESEVLQNITDFICSDEMNKLMLQAAYSVYAKGISVGLTNLYQIYNGENNPALIILSAKEQFPIYYPQFLLNQASDKQVFDNWTKNSRTDNLISAFHESRYFDKSIKDAKKHIIEPMLKLGLYTGASYIREKYYTPKSNDSEYFIGKEFPESFFPIGTQIMGKTIYFDHDIQIVTLYESVVSYTSDVTLNTIGTLTITANSERNNGWKLTHQTMESVTEDNASDNELVLYFSGQLRLNKVRVDAYLEEYVQANLGKFLGDFIGKQNTTYKRIKFIAE